jgi:hypothetical protein
MPSPPLTLSQRIRAINWEEGFIVCRLHPERRCNKSAYVHGRARRCSNCKVRRRPDGTRRPASVRYSKSPKRLEAERYRSRSRRTTRRIDLAKI